MAKQGISTGSSPNDGTGDTLLAGAEKVNENFKITALIPFTAIAK